MAAIANTILVISLAGAGLCVLMGIAIIACAAYFFRYRQFRFYTKRNPPLLLAQAGFASIISIVTEPLAILHFAGVLDMTSFGRTLTWVFGMHMFFLCICLRFWLLLFEYKHSDALKNEKWRRDINPDYEDFYLESRRTFGSAVWMMRRGLIGEVLILIAMILTDVFGQQIAWYAINVVFMICVGVFITTAFSELAEVEFEDPFYMKLELYLVKNAAVVNIGLYSALSGIHAFTRRIEFGIGVAVLSSEMTCLIWMLSSLYVIHVHNEATSEHGKKKLRLKRNTSASNSRSSRHQHKSSGDQGSTKHERQSELILYIETQAAFDAFMQHLVSEFSLESLLFIVELMQYKSLFPHTTTEEDEELRRQVDALNTAIVRDRLSYIGLINNGSNHSQSGRGIGGNGNGNGNSVTNTPRPSTSELGITKPVILPPGDLSSIARVTGIGEKRSDGKEPELRMRLPPNLPVSPLKQLDDVFERGRYLYEKYIQPQSDLELNIPWEMRKQLGNFFGDENIVENSPRPNDDDDNLEYDVDSPGPGDLAYLRLVFDDAAREVVDLMLDAFERFQNSEEFVVPTIPAAMSTLQVNIDMAIHGSTTPSSTSLV